MAMSRRGMRGIPPRLRASAASVAVASTNRIALNTEGFNSRNAALIAA